MIGSVECGVLPLPPPVAFAAASAMAASSESVPTIPDTAVSNAFSGAALSSSTLAFGFRRAQVRRQSNRLMRDSGRTEGLGQLGRSAKQRDARRVLAGRITLRRRCG